MKAHEMRQLKVSELQARMKDEREAVRKLRFDQAVAGQIENPSRIRAHRREIARLNTIITELQKAESSNS